jgi:putative transposase
MPRQGRLDAPGVLHHVMIRGIERRTIFHSNKDRDDFIARLATLVPETKTACYAWVLMPNHAHFLLHSGPEGISSFIRRLLTGYVVSFNRRHHRAGQLFQNRYKSIVCQEDIYFQELVRYIHLNPLRAKLVPDLPALNHSPYSGHSVLMGVNHHLWQDTAYVLRTFSASPHKARQKYLSYVEAGIGQPRREDQRHLHVKNRVSADERILGESAFVTRVLQEANQRLARRYDLRRRGYTLERLAEKVSRLHGLNSKDVLTRGRQTRLVEARSLLCYFAVHALGIPAVEPAKRFTMTPSAISYAVVRGKEIAERNHYEVLSEDTN